MSIYKLRDVAIAFDDFSQSKLIWPDPNFTIETREFRVSCYPVISESDFEARKPKHATRTSETRAGLLFRTLVTNYVVRQQLFEHLSPIDIANLIYAARIGQDIGQGELRRHIHPMRYVFDNDELGIISKRVKEGYAIVLWGRDLKELVDIIEKPFSYRGKPIFFKPCFRQQPPMQLDITEFAPPHINSAEKPVLPGFPWSNPIFTDSRKRICPTKHFQIFNYKSSLSWGGIMSALPLEPYVPESDAPGLARLVSYESGPTLHYINFHESSLVLRSCHTKPCSVPRYCPSSNTIRDMVGCSFEAHMKGKEVSLSPDRNPEAFNFNSQK